MNLGNISIFIFSFVINFTLAFFLISYIWPNTKSVNGLNQILINKTLIDNGKDGILLSNPIPIATSDEFIDPFFMNGGGSLVFYIYLQPGQRTKLIGSNYSNILNVDKCLALQVSNSDDSAQLEVYTQRATPEIIALPPIPRQTWVQVAVLREGRRFDILYNNKTVVSERLERIPMVNKNSLYSGSSNLQGVIGNVRVAARRLSYQEVIVEHTRSSDTRGKPYFKVKDAIASGAFCPPGVSCPTTNTPPASPLEFWTTPYN
uniref:Uncharacterized protein n=1 Tax=viral metagenome TaxID=1070528 RepID=A0A6C0IE41_9ZZZZ